MKTVALSRLGYEDLSPTNIVALSLHWGEGSRTLYRGDGRPDNMLFYTVSGARAYSQEGCAPFDVGPGDLMLMPAGSRYLSTVTSAGGTDGYCLQFMLRDESGAPCRQFLNECRLRRARELLGAGESVAETARAAGYDDALEFSRFFKAHTGLSPSAYAAKKSGRDQ